MAFPQILAIRLRFNSFYSKKPVVQTPKSQEIGIKFTIIVCLNFDKPNDVQELILCLSYFITTVPPKQVNWSVKKENRYM